MISAVYAPDTLSSNLQSRVSLGVKLRLNTGDETNKVQMRMLGPGDVTGFDSRQVIRTIPQHLTPEFEPNYFPAIEFDRPDFPWLFTPASANSKKQLRPWICLVVVPKQESILVADPNRPLPILKVKDTQTDLLDLSESWAWAHAQISGPLGVGGITQVLSKNSERCISRLLCPRHLKSNTSYYACVVPTFEVGLKAGLGQEITNEDYGKLEPAWKKNVASAVELPVYYHWEFSTGAEGDFESLVWLLERRELSTTEVGIRDMLIKDLGAGLPDIGIIGLEGALLASAPSPVTISNDFQNKMSDLLNAAENLSSGDSIVDHIVLPPIYGRWHAATRKITFDLTTPKWLRELNVDPRYRVAAGLGTLVVQENQEQLMAAAWEQVDEIERTNQILRQTQLARAASITIYQGHIKQMSPEKLFTITIPVSSHVMMGKQPNSSTILHQAKQSILPRGTVSSQFRRMTRPRGPLARHSGINSTALNWTNQLIKRLNNGELIVAPEDTEPDGMITIDDVFKDLRDTDHDESIFEKLCRITPDVLKSMLQSLSDSTGINYAKKIFGKIAIEQQRDTPPCEKEKPVAKPPLDLSQIKATLLTELDPNKTVIARLKKRLIVSDSWNPEDPLEPVMAAPDFPTAMYKPLANLSQDWLLPGLENISPNTIALLRSNAKFIESYMVGLNHEMSRELLWRGFPTDQRGTCFRQFWDKRGHVPSPTTPEQRESLRDIKPIHLWERSSGMGENLESSSSSTDQISLIIRGDLLRRYPNAIIYIAKAKWVPKKDKDRNIVKDENGEPVMVREPDNLEEEFPIYQGTLNPDITLIGFNRDPQDIKGNDEIKDDAHAGWFVIIQQQPTEPLFGLDETPSTADPNSWTWRDLSWKHVKVDGGDHIKLADGLSDFNITNSKPDEPTLTSAWSSNSNSSSLAYVTLQEPFRIAIHASDLLPLGGGS
jgi:hypothetical protein